MSKYSCHVGTQIIDNGICADLCIGVHWQIGRERMEVQVTYLQPVLGNTHVLQECLESGVTVILLVYDISQYVSFQGLQEWIQNLRETKGGARRMMFLVGNRLDHERMVQVAVAQVGDSPVDSLIG